MAFVSMAQHAAMIQRFDEKFAKLEQTVIELTGDLLIANGKLDGMPDKVAIMFNTQSEPFMDTIKLINAENSHKMESIKADCQKLYDSCRIEFEQMNGKFGAIDLAVQQLVDFMKWAALEMQRLAATEGMVANMNSRARSRRSTTR